MSNPLWVAVLKGTSSTKLWPILPQILLWLWPSHSELCRQTICPVLVVTFSAINHKSQRLLRRMQPISKGRGQGETVQWQHVLLQCSWQAQEQRANRPWKRFLFRDTTQPATDISYKSWSNASSFSFGGQSLYMTKRATWKKLWTWHLVQL